MELILGFIGFTDVRPVIIEPTLESTPEELENILVRAGEQARETAALL